MKMYIKLSGTSQAFSILFLLRYQIHQALPPEVKAMWESEQVRVEVRGFSPGSVVAHLTIVFTPSQSQDIINVSAAVLQSLMNSTKYSVDPHSINVTGTSFSLLQRARHFFTVPAFNTIHSNLNLYKVRPEGDSITLVTKLHVPLLTFVCMFLTKSSFVSRILCCFRF